MKKNRCISALIFCGFFATAQTDAQSQQVRDSSSNRGDQGAAATFTAAADATNNGVVTIRWNNANDKGTDHFAIEHSTDGVHFETLREVAIKGDTSLDPQSYQEEDGAPASQDNYYRLAIVSKDSNSFYSPVVEVDMTDKKGPAVLPTMLPMGGTLRVEASYRDAVQINFFDESGNRVGGYTVNSSASTATTISTMGWRSGVYSYRISDALHPLIDAGRIMVL